MNKSALYKSLALHFVVFLLITVDFSFFSHDDFKLEQVPIIVDLSQVNISEMTNLPAKAEVGEKTKVATQSKPVKKQEPSSSEPAPSDEKPIEPKQDYIVPPQPSKPKLPEKKPEPKKPTPPPQPKKPAKPKPQPKKKEPETVKPDTMLKNLMESVNAIEKQLSEKDNSATIEEGTKVANMGVEGGGAGSYFTELSITETDAIASRLRACWNLDPGARGIEDMIIEIRAYLNKDGSVQKVDILDSSRYRNDTHFRSIADSAKRAVYVCAPYSILTEKHGDKYDMWKTMLLRFNPINHTVN